MTERLVDWLRIKGSSENTQWDGSIVNTMHMYLKKEKELLEQLRRCKLYELYCILARVKQRVVMMYNIPYIRLFTRHVLSENSSLKWCIKSTRVKFSWNTSERFNILYLEERVKFTRLQFSRIWYSGEHSGKWMPDIRYPLKCKLHMYSV